MCSNTSLSSGCNGSIGDSVGHHGRVTYSKKPKRARVPKRGPGVAELEKILREQENKTDLYQNNNQGFSLFTSFSESSVHISSFNSPSKPNQLCSSDVERFSPSKIALIKESENIPLRLNNGHEKKDIQIGGSRIFLPEHTLLPTKWESEYSRKSFPRANQRFSSPHIMQRVQYSPSCIIDVFSNNAVSSAATTSTASGIEPHSNQVSYPHFDSFLPHEHKMVGTKRLRTYSMDLPDIPVLPQPHSHQKNRIGTSLPYLANFQPTDAVSRSGLNQYGEKDITPEKERFNLDHMPFQDVKEREKAFQERKASDDQSVEKKAVHNFLFEKDQTEFNLNDEADDAEEEDAIDLNLKL